METAQEYGFQSRADVPAKALSVAPPRPTDLSPEAVLAVAEGRRPIPEGFWGSFSRPMVLFRQAVQAHWKAQEEEERRRARVESAAYRVVQDARAGRLGTIDMFLKHDERGEPYATHVRFNNSPRAYSIEDALDARLIT